MNDPLNIKSTKLYVDNTSDHLVFGSICQINNFWLQTYILANLSVVCETVEISSEIETLEFTGFFFSGEKSEKQLHFVLSLKNS